MPNRDGGGDHQEGAGSRAGILKMSRVGNQHHYQANPDCPVYSELAGIAKKTSVIRGVIDLGLPSSWMNPRTGR